MSEREIQELYKRIIDALEEDGITPESPETVAKHIVAAVEWDAVIVSTEEWQDVRTMRSTIMELSDYVREWTDER